MGENPYKQKLSKNIHTAEGGRKKYITTQKKHAH
jgi:hypothetical protein